MTPSRDLFANFERMRREIDQLFGDVFERSTGLRGRGFSPSVDVYYADDPPRAVVKADLAGVDIEDVALEIRGRQLLIAGERRAAEAAGRLYQQIEIEHGPFRRMVELGADVIAEEAKASYEDGILRVEVPLAPREEEPARRVPIEEGEDEPGLEGGTA
jgi:HSP20 family protein